LFIDIFIFLACPQATKDSNFVTTIQSQRQLFRMAAIPFCIVPGAQVTHFVIEVVEDLNVPVYPSATVYDTLQLPVYKPHGDHAANYAALLVELGPVSPSGCICGLRKAAALGCKFQYILLER
jgi:hypothetical protein